MAITAAFAADLALLTQALDEPGADLERTLRRLASGARTAVASYVGLTVIVRHVGSSFEITALDGAADPPDVASSLSFRLPLAQRRGQGGRLVLILYAGTSGAFVDLAADLSWLTGLPLRGFVLDEDLQLPAEPHADTADRPSAASIVGQAIGVLIGQGQTPEQADANLDSRARAAGTDRYEAALTVLAAITRREGSRPPELA